MMTSSSMAPVSCLFMALRPSEEELVEQKIIPKLEVVVPSEDSPLLDNIVRFLQTSPFVVEEISLLAVEEDDAGNLPDSVLQKIQTFLALIQLLQQSLPGDSSSTSSSTKVYKITLQQLPRAPSNSTISCEWIGLMEDQRRYVLINGITICGTGTYEMGTLSDLLTKPSKTVDVLTFDDLETDLIRVMLDKMENYRMNAGRLLVEEDQAIMPSSDLIPSSPSASPNQNTLYYEAALKRLQLRDIQFTTKALQSLAMALRYNQHLRKLRFYRCTFPHEAGDIFQKVFAQTQNIRKVFFTQCEFATSEACQMAVHGFLSNTSVRELEFDATILDIDSDCEEDRVVRLAWKATPRLRRRRRGNNNDDMANGVLTEVTRL